MVPPVALQESVGRVLLPLLQVADAVNCWVAPGLSVTDFGLMLRAVRVGVGLVTCTVAVSAFPQVHEAITAKLPATDPAVNNPLEEMVPPVAVYVTWTERLTPSDQVAEVPNCWLPPGAKLAVRGEILNAVTVAAPIVTEAVSALPPPLAMTRNIPAVVPAV
jgi:hypothetical protein